MPKETKPGEWAKRIRALMESAQLSQAALAEHLESESSQGTVSQGTVSSWLRGDDTYTPSGKMFAQLGNLAAERGLDPSWFWERAGLDVRSVLAHAGELLKAKSAPVKKASDIVRVSHLTAAGGKAELILPASLIPSPLATRYVVAGEINAGMPFSHSDVLVLDISTCDFIDLSGKLVLVEFLDLRRPPWTALWGNWPKGACSVFGGVQFGWRGSAEIYSATLHPFGEAERPIDISIYDAQKFIKPGHSLLGRDQRRAAEQAAKSEMRLAEGCRVVGRMVAWFSAEQGRGH